MPFNKMTSYLILSTLLLMALACGVESTPSGFEPPSGRYGIFVMAHIRDGPRWLRCAPTLRLRPSNHSETRQTPSKRRPSPAGRPAATGFCSTPTPMGSTPLWAFT